jgi:hypothetical protein
MWQRIVKLVLGVVPVASLGCGQVSGDQSARVQYPFVLTLEEIGLARVLAENDLVVDSLPSGPRTVFVKVDLLPDSQAEMAHRLVMVHHYRYHTDQTIFTMIDLNTHEVLKREFHVHYPTALAPTEIERAFQLARADDRLQTVLTAQPTNLDARPIQYAAPEEPLFGHRVVHVLLRHDGNYLMAPRVLVDLTTETVHLD